MQHRFHAFSLAFILLHCFAALAGEVRVLAPLTRVATSTAQLREWCPNEGQYDACTRMIAYRLDAHCSSDGGAWKLDVSATFRPWIFLFNLQRLSHEKEHIEDIRRAAERHVAGLEAMRFDSHAACEARALAEHAGFEMHMAGFALESNLARHPQLRMIAGK